MPVTLATKVPKMLLVDICMLYEVAPVAAFHPNVNASGSLIELFGGCDNVGVFGGRGTVVKLHTADHELVPPALLADTCQ